MSLTKQQLLDSMQNVMNRQLQPYADAGLQVVGQTFMDAPNKHISQLKLNLRMLASMQPEDPKWEQAHASIGAASLLLALCNAVVAVYNKLEAAFPDSAHEPPASERARWQSFAFFFAHKRRIPKMNDEQLLEHVQLEDDAAVSLDTSSKSACVTGGV